MHKRRVNELKLQLVIEADGPILIKSGGESGADPTLPAMNFVRTQHPHSGERTIYLPGSSLKGVIRSHSERIIRTVLGDKPHICCDPLNKDTHCFARLHKSNAVDTAEQYRQLCLACRIFGHMHQASHFYTADAYPQEAVDTLPIRHNVAIDRLSGGVAVGPFDMEVSLDTRFATQLTLTNFELWQVGLLALALRDVGEGRVRLGFAKSRGLGQVKVYLTYLEVGYPGQFAQTDRWRRELLGVGALAEDLIPAYGYVNGPDALPYAAVPQEKADEARWGRPTFYWGEVHVEPASLPIERLAAAHQAVTALLGQTVSAWGALVARRQEAQHG